MEIAMIDLSVSPEIKFGKARLHLVVMDQHGDSAMCTCQHEPFPRETFAKIVGGRNWVIARRSSRIVERYGDDVICLSPQRYRDAERIARLMQTEGLD
jgi:hypothetical protein